MDENNLNTGSASAETPSVSTPAAPKKEKLTHKEKRRRWKAAKKAKRQELKDYYHRSPA